MKARPRPTSQERQVMKKIISQHLIKQSEEYSNDLDAAVLYTLHSKHGWGAKRLRKFYEEFREACKDLEDYYEMPTEAGWLCRTKLKEIGVDIEAGNAEQRRNKNA